MVDEGPVLVKGEPVRFHSPKDAINRGIGMVHQHFMLIPVMTVAENIVLATEPSRAGILLDYATARKRVGDLSKTFGFAIDPDGRVESIPVGQQQRVEILKALYRHADILILDEPTAVLTPQEARELFEILRTLTREGMSVIFITHKLNEVLDIADRITVLRGGEQIDTVSRAGATEDGLARMMVGRDVVLRVDKEPSAPAAPGSRSGVLARREPRASRLRQAAQLAPRLALSPADRALGARSAPAVRRTRRRSTDARVGALGWQSAKSRARPRDLSRPGRAPGCSADARPRRRCDRVRAPAARRGARSGEGGSPRVARGRRDSVAVRPHPRHLRGPNRGRIRSRRQRGRARSRDDRWSSQGGCVSEKAVAPPPASSPETVPSVAARLAFYQRAGGVVTPLLTAVVAFFIGGLVILATTGKNPLSTYHAIFNGTGLNWFFHVGSYSVGVPFTDSRVWFPWNTGSLAALNLQQTLLIMTPLMLTGLAVAFAFRCGLFNIGGNGQYTVGALVGVQFGVWFAGMPGVLHALLVMAAATLAGGPRAGDPGLLEAAGGG